MRTRTRQKEVAGGSAQLGAHNIKNTVGNTGAGVQQQSSGRGCSKRQVSVVVMRVERKDG